MKKFELYDAKVISIDDPDTKGKIQIQILPELKDIATSNLPWAIPFISHSSSSEIENDLPIVGSLVRVLVSNRWKRFYYLPNRFFEDLFNFTNVSNTISKASEITGTAYKDLKFRLYKDGGLEFHNNNTGEHGFIHKSGSYQVFDANGNIITNMGANTWKLYGTVGAITASLKTILVDVNTILKHTNTILTNLNTVGNLTSPSGTVVVTTGPTDLITLTNDLATITSDLTKLDNLMS